MINKLETSLVFEERSDDYKISAVDHLSLINIHKFIRGNEVALECLSDYELMMIFMHKEIMLSATDNCLCLAIKRFLASDINLTYKQFSLFVNSITLLRNKKSALGKNPPPSALFLCLCHARHER